MRRFAFRIGVSGSLALAVAASCLLVGERTATGLAESHAISGPFRVLYASDWSGSSEIYAADPSGARPTKQLTFGRPPVCAEAACGYGAIMPSPNGRLILYTDWTSSPEPAHTSALFMARANGTRPRAVGPAYRPCSANGAGGLWAPDSKRVAYAGNGRIHIVDVDGRHDRTVARGECFSWSPDGKSLAFTAHTYTPTGGNAPLSVRRDGHSHVVAAAASQFAWSPNGRWLAYTVLSPNGPDELDIVRPNGSARRSLLNTQYLPDAPPEWSADSRYLSVPTRGIEVVNAASGASRMLDDSRALAWKPQGHVLAVTDANGISLVDAATGQRRLLTRDRAVDGSWSPDGRLLAYDTDASPEGSYQLDFPRALRVVSLAGKTRTLARADGVYGGVDNFDTEDTGGPVWARVPRGVQYRRPQPRVLASVRADSLTAPWPIALLAADGTRVAYVSCGHVFVWTPSLRTVVQAEPNSSLSPRCSTPDDYLSFWLYSLALSGDGIAFGYFEGNSSQEWGLYAGRVEDVSSLSLVAEGSGNAGCPLGPAGLGDLAGAGNLLVFSRWQRGELAQTSCGPITSQEIDRLDPGGCPCPRIATSPGPLLPADVDGDRVVALGSNETLVLDRNGQQLSSVPVHAAAAQLSGSDLVVVVQGQLRDYDAKTGALAHAWALPDVPSGGPCAGPFPSSCASIQLELEDASHGLATYVLDGQVHVLQLADGTDRTVGAGAFARFMDAGLVYADGADLHLVPFTQLSLP